jgi:ankyrin repeat protein
MNPDRKLKDFNTHITTFYEAISFVDLDYIKRWIKAGADVNQVDDNGLTPLHYAIKFAKTDILTLIEIIEIFIKNGADINKRVYNDTMTLLHYAVYYQMNIDILKFLIKNGANINAVGRCGKTILNDAISNNDLKTVILLIENGVDVNLADDLGFKPLHRAMLNYTLGKSNTMTLIKFLIENGVDINQITLNGKTFFYDAIIMNMDETIIKYFIKKGANVNLVDHCGINSLMYCLVNGIHRYLPILLAAGAENTNVNITFPEIDIVQLNFKYHFNMKTLLLQKKEIDMAGFKAIMDRAGTICIAMQDLDLPAPQMIEIIVQECVPFAENLPYHYLWDLVVTVKHFHDRHVKELKKYFDDRLSKARRRKLLVK